MRIVFFIILFITNLLAQKVLLINSNSSVEKYNSVQKGFESSYDKPFKTIDISKMSRYEIKEYLYDEYPDIVYAIGSKAYQYANRYIPEKKIFFSSIVNYKRLNISSSTMGVANEVHAGMKLTLIKNMFPEIDRLKLIYSSYTKDIFESYKKMSEVIKLEVEGIDVAKINSEELLNLFDGVDGVILIPDPILIKNEKLLDSLFEVSKDIKKPIFAYHELFLKYGALLSISVDNPTVGRQISSMLELYTKENLSDNIQMPMGTKIMLNKRVLEDFGTRYNKSIFSQVNKVVE